MLVVHALPLHYPSPEIGDMRQAYASIGVTDVVSLLTLTRDYGPTAPSKSFVKLSRPF